MSSVRGALAKLDNDDDDRSRRASHSKPFGVGSGRIPTASSGKKNKAIAGPHTSPSRANRVKIQPGIALNRNKDSSKKWDQNSTAHSGIESDISHPRRETYGAPAIQKRKKDSGSSEEHEDSSGGWQDTAVFVETKSKKNTKKPVSTKTKRASSNPSRHLESGHQSKISNYSKLYNQKKPKLSVVRGAEGTTEYPEKSERIEKVPGKKRKEKKSDPVTIDLCSDSDAEETESEDADTVYKEGSSASDIMDKENTVDSQFTAQVDNKFTTINKVSFGKMCFESTGIVLNNEGKGTMDSYLTQSAGKLDTVNASKKNGLHIMVNVSSIGFKIILDTATSNSLVKNGTASVSGTSISSFILRNLEQENNNNSNVHAVIPLNEIRDIHVRFAEKNDNYKGSYVVLFVKSSLRLDQICAVGNNRTLDPDCIPSTNRKGDESYASKYIVMTMMRNQHDAFQRSICRIIQNYNKNKSKEFGIKYTAIGGKDDDKYLSALNASIDMKRKWEKECERGLQQLERSSRRTRRNSLQYPSTAIGDKEGDYDTYLLYPPGEDAFDVITITNGDIRRLKEAEYLNDSLIDMQLRRLILSNAERTDDIYAFNCLFWPQLTGQTADKRGKKGFTKVSRWTKKFDIFSKKLLVVPINKTEHWSVIFVVRPDLLLDGPLVEQGDIDAKKETGANVGIENESADNNSSHKQELQSEGNSKAIDNLDDIATTATAIVKSGPRVPCILLCDSLKMHNPQQLITKITDYLRNEFRDKKCLVVDEEMDGKEKEDILKRNSELVEQFNTRCDGLNSVVLKDIPHQENGYDCGMYVIKYVEMMLKKSFDEMNDPEMIENKGKFLFSRENDFFTPADVTQERMQIVKFLEDTRPEYIKNQSFRDSKDRRERYEKQRVKAEKEKKYSTTLGSDREQATFSLDKMDVEENES